MLKRKPKLPISCWSRSEKIMKMLSKNTDVPDIPVHAGEGAEKNRQELDLSADNNIMIIHTDDAQHIESAELALLEDNCILAIHTDNDTEHKSVKPIEGDELIIQADEFLSTLSDSVEATFNVIEEVAEIEVYQNESAHFGDKEIPGNCPNEENFDFNIDRDKDYTPTVDENSDFEKIPDTFNHNEINGAYFAEEEVSGNCPNDKNHDLNVDKDKDYIPLFDESSDSDFEEVPDLAENDDAQTGNMKPIEVEEQEDESNNDNNTSTRCDPSEKKTDKDRRIFKSTSAHRLNQKRKRECGMAYVGLVSKTDDESQAKRWEYVNRPSRQLKPPCNCKPSENGKTFKCRNIPEKDREKLFTNFWKQLTWLGKRTLISSLVDVENPKDKRNRKDVENSRRAQTFKYHLKFNDQRLRVCSKQFFNTFDVKFDFVSNCINGNREAIASPEEDVVNEEEESVFKRRSSKARNNKDAIAKLETMKNFITSLPRMESHYCRQNTGKFFLEPVFQTKMDVYRAYKTEVEKSGGPGVVSSTTFMEEFDQQRLSIYTPRKDLCDLCVSYKVGNCSKEVYEAHQIRKAAARKEKDDDNKGPHYVATLDMQGVLLSPTGFNASALYYKMKLCVHNFTVFNNKTHEVMCYVWHEGEGGITSNEFASLYVDYIRQIAPTLSPDQDVILWSDGAGYQNRNQNLSNALLKLSSELNITIIQKYLEVGHTQMECDSIHAQIERKLRNKPIYTPADYLDVMRNARVNPGPYSVQYVNHSLFSDFSKLGPMDSIRPGRTVGDPKVNDLRALKYTPSGQMFFKLAFEGNWTLFEKRTRRNSFEGKIKRLYDAPLKIKIDKYKHLQELKNFLPKDYHFFYDHLPH